MLDKSFFKKSTLNAAQNLLGCYLIHNNCTGKIVETEAYLHNDKASHSFKGKTNRNEAMFSEAGKAYVYFTYGMHHCFNVVTNKKGVGEAVLIRALELIKGIEIMKKRRKTNNVRDLCNGPAKLVIAFGIKKEYNSHVLTKKPLYISERDEKPNIACSKRIGISKDKNLPYRFYIKDNEFVSKNKEQELKTSLLLNAYEK